MNRETLIWTILLIAGSLYLGNRAINSPKGVGQIYVVPVELAGRFDPTTKKIVSIEPGEQVAPSELRKVIRFDKAPRGAEGAVWSPARTVGLWAAALLSLCVFSYLYRDNVFYKLAESIIVGVSAGYWVVLYSWEVLVGKILVRLAPSVARYAFIPDVAADAQPQYLYIVPMILGCLIFCRLVPKIAWMGRWPLAFAVGTTAGLKLILFLDADFIRQLRSTVLPFVVFTSDGTLDWKQMIQNFVIVMSVISSLTYFYFSVEHKGWVGRISRAGVWVLMISFGASFALTVMGRITLLTMRLQFLFDDWLGLVKM